MTTVRWRFPLAGSVVVVALTAGVGTQSARPMGIVDLLNIPRVADPQVSPDGRDVMYTRADADWKVGRRISHPKTADEKARERVKDDVYAYDGKKDVKGTTDQQWQ